MNKYVVRTKKKTNNAFDVYKNVTLNGVPEEESTPRPVRKKEQSTKPKVDTLYQKEALGIVDVYQAQTSTEDGGENVLRFELVNGTTRDFVVKNGKTGETGNTGLGGIRGPRGATGAQGPRGSSGVYVGSGEMPADCNVQIDPDGEPMDVVAEVLAALPTWNGGSY